MKLVMLVLLIAGSAQAQLRPRHRFAVTGEQVSRAIMKALAEQGYAGEAKVVLLSAVTATEAEPVLQVESLEGAIGDRRAVRIGCKVQGVCLPFYAAVNWPSGASRQVVVKGAVKPVAPVVMRAGTPAVMVMDDGRATVRLSVVSLESGAAGRVIRVASQDRKHMYRAEVVSVDVVRGSF